MGPQAVINRFFNKILQCVANSIFIHYDTFWPKLSCCKILLTMDKWSLYHVFITRHCFFPFFCFFCLTRAPLLNFCFLPCNDTIVRALSPPARGRWGRESFPICVGYLVFITFWNTGWEIKSFRCFFIPFTIFCCSLSVSSSLPLPEEMHITFTKLFFIFKKTECVKRDFYQPIKRSSSRSTSKASAACLNQELWCFSLLLWNSIFSICLAKFTRSLIASMHLVSIGNMGSSSSFPRFLQIFLKFIMSSGPISSKLKPCLVALAVLPLRWT